MKMLLLCSAWMPHVRYPNFLAHTSYLRSGTTGRSHYVLIITSSATVATRMLSKVCAKAVQTPICSDVDMSHYVQAECVTT
ncbi:uncharacterized protein BJ212DRAFT_1378500 [Suillus subaureus]|uniref:Uncharacterized protein n=1 Tax=Suillus subaureus TaxID=48587 RepID=A0A9P7E294_9AGAM|nr:uncharacterized protein BJ212DRAFT_1378500 [Suillus subaureus]KAG1809616.1 hypothetical protein BJ212DRAFT_1378500 [Suillus subaureus]